MHRGVDASLAAPGISFRYFAGADGTVEMEAVGQLRSGDVELDVPWIVEDPWSFVHVDDRAELQHEVLSATVERRRIDATFRMRRPDGEPQRWLRAMAQPGPPQEGGQIFHGLLIDITEERERQAFERSQWDLLARIAAGARLGPVLDELCRLIEKRIPNSLATVLLLDRERRTLRYGASPTLDSGYMGAVEGASVGPDEGSCGAAVHTGTRVISADMDQDPKWVNWLELARQYGLRACWSEPFFDGQGLSAGTVAVYFRQPREPSLQEIDVLESSARLAGIAVQQEEAVKTVQETEQRLQQAQKMEAVGQLAGGVAHDFNNLLTVIQSAASVLWETLPEGSEFKADAALIVEASERAEALTRQLLTFGRRQAWSPEAVSVRDVVRRVQTMLSRLLGERIALNLRGSHSHQLAWIDPIQLEQILINLVVNAKDAMPGGGLVDIQIEDVTVEDSGPSSQLLPGDRAVRLKVRDTGVGMTPEVRARIFEPFFTTKAAGKGTGLGLAVVFGIVERAGGSIQVQTGVGEGTTFIIDLPVATDDSDTLETVAQPRFASRTGHRQSVLLVEDDPGVRSITARILRSRGYEVVEAEHGEAGLRALQARNGGFSLVLSDVVMPGISGRDLLRWVRERYPQLPVLLMSGYAEATVAVPGELPILTKPFPPEELTQRVRESIEAA